MSAKWRILISLFLFFFFLPIYSFGANFRVNSTYDVQDLSPGNGMCVAYLLIAPPYVVAFCTLRAAIEEANSLPGVDTIALSSTSYRLSLQGAGEEKGASGDLDITDSLILEGNGIGKTVIDGNFIDRVFDIKGSNTTVTLKNVTLINGGGNISAGGVIKNGGNIILDNVEIVGNDSLNGDSQGGILFNSGNCKVIESTLTDGVAREGGAVYNRAQGDFLLQRSTVTANESKYGAGINNHGTMFIINSTISGNGSSKTGYGGGVENWGTVTIHHATIAENKALEGGGISNKGVVWLQNSILFNENGGDCYQPAYIFSQGYNLVNDESCLLNNESDMQNINPRLKPLAGNGGVTLTHALYPDSPARNSGLFVATENVDQRGVKRPKGRQVDRGSYEWLERSIAPILYPLLGGGKIQ